VYRLFFFLQKAHFIQHISTKLLQVKIGSLHRYFSFFEFAQREKIIEQVVEMLDGFFYFPVFWRFACCSVVV